MPFLIERDGFAGYHFFRALNFINTFFTFPVVPRTHNPCLSQGAVHYPSNPLSQTLVLKGIYILPRLKILMRSQNPITPAITNPARPITGMSCHLGEMPAKTIREEPINRDARTMANASRLLTRSKVDNKGSMPRWWNSIFIFPSLVCLSIFRISPGMSFHFQISEKLLKKQPVKFIILAMICARQVVVLFFVQRAQLQLEPCRMTHHNV